MLLLILSDSHGNRNAFRRVIEQVPNADSILFLGDGIEDAMAMEKQLPLLHTACRSMICVRGNCDFFAIGTPAERVIELEGHRIFLCHGHTRDVKQDLLELRYKAAEEHAQLALFGHTHLPYLLELDGITLLNPGSLGQSFDGKIHYATVELHPDGIRAALGTRSL